MFPVSLNLIPVPSDESLFEEGHQYLVVDQNGVYHIAVWDAEDEVLVIPDSLEVVTEPEEVEEATDPADVDTSPVPVAGDSLVHDLPLDQAVAAAEPEAEAEEEGATMEEDDDAVFVCFVARLPEFVAPEAI